jgi:N-formylglutamate deformylase
MDERAPFAYRPDLAREVQPALRDMIVAAHEWVRT